MYDVIIIGAGITGLGSAWHLTETLKKKVLMIEQFPFPHQFGSSAGHSRITRQLYKEDFNCTLMKEATTMWRVLEEKTGETLFIQNGFLSFGPFPEMKSYLEAIKNSSISAYEISSDEINKKYSNLKIPKDYCVIFDPIGGLLNADKCLKALMNQSIKNGMEFHEMEKVLDISVISDMEVNIKTNKGKYTSKAVIIASGIWSETFLKMMDVNFPITPFKIYYGLFKPNDESDMLTFDYKNMPSFISTTFNTYGLSGSEYPGCLKIGNFVKKAIEQDNRDSDEGTDSSKGEFLKVAKSFLSTFIPKCSLVPVNITTCVITTTPDEQPIIDKHSRYKNVVIGCGFNGCGFKTGVIHGKLLAQLATNQECSYDIKPFSIARFNS